MLRLVKVYITGFVFILFGLEAYAGEQLLRIHGSNTVGAALIPQLVQGWLKDKGYIITANRETAPEERKITARKGNKDFITVEIQAHGSSTSFKSLGARYADLGMSSRPIKSSELVKLEGLGKLNTAETEYIIAIDGLAVIVNKSSPVKTLAKADLKKIFSGKITNWTELGYKAGKINVYARDDKSGTYDTFKSLVLGKKTPLIKTAKRYESNEKLSYDVSRDTNGIGFVGLAYVNKSRAVSVSDEDSAALAPSVFNVATEDYALSRRLFLYLPSENTHALAQSLAEYAKTDAGQQIASQVGFVSQEVVAYETTVAKDAPDEYKKYIQNAKRLSLNIRFKQGHSFLDNKAVHDVGRLLKFMQRPVNKNKKVMLFGFSDKDEVIPYMSLSLSIDRADVVADKLLLKHLEPLHVRGYGQAMPVSNNKTESGRLRNRRVEVWVAER